MDKDVAAAPAEPPADSSRYLPALPQRLFTRRRFITVLGGSGIGGYLWHADLADASRLTQFVKRLPNRVVTDLRKAAEVVQANPLVNTARPTRTLTVDLVRRDDMLRLRLELFNIIVSSNPNQFVRKATNQPAYVVVNFPPQHLAEEALLRVGGQSHYSGEPVNKSGGDGADEYFYVNAVARARLAGESRLVFEVPASSFPMPRTQEALLNWLPWKARLAPTARIGNDSSGPSLKAPVPTSANEPGETALEIPWRLILSPLPFGAWLHNRAPKVSSAGVTEMWHTRLGAQVPIQTQNGTFLFVDESGKRPVRAIWSTDKYYPPTSDAPPNDVYDDDDKGARTKSAGKATGDGNGDGQPFAPFRTSLSPRNRVQIVQNSAGFKRPQGSVRPIDVNRLMLSPLGATVDLVGKWPDPKSIDLILWRHRATLGRDAFVETIERGFFLPWGFEAVRIKITKRVAENRDFAPGSQGKLNVAFLEQRIHYVILDPVIDFPAAGHAGQAFNMPFRRIRAKTVITPDVDDDVNLFNPAIVPSLGKKSETQSPAGSPNGAFRFDLESTDWEGRVQTFRQPMAFLYFSQITKKDDLTGGTASLLNATVLRTKWNLLPPDHVLKNAPMRGQKVAYGAPDKAGDTSFETSWLSTNLDGPVGTIGKNQPLFVPIMDRSNIRLEAAEAVSGASLDGGTQVAYPPHYSATGFASNKPSTFLKLLAPTNLEFGRTDHSGGVAAPSLKLTALSRARGAIGGTEASQLADKFVPTEWFNLPSANLLGVDLVDVIANGDLSKSMTMKSTETTQGRQVQLSWIPQLKSSPLLLNNRAGKNGTFRLDATILRKPDGTVTSDIRGELHDVTMQLLGDDLHFLDIGFQHLIFTQKDQTSPHLDVKLGDIKFAGPLQFVNELRKVLQNQSGPISVDVNGDGIVARTSVSVPSIGVGIFSLTNLALSAEVGVPFSPSPSYANFAISSKQDPFHVSVSIFGGGGWFALGVNTLGLQSIEAGFEFGGTVSLDFGVAGGSIEIMAGIYFKLESVPGKGDRIQLTGYVRFHGEVHVGFVSLGLSAELDLSYVSKKDHNGKQRQIVTGRCEVTLEVPIAPDITFEIEKSFGGDPHDPRFVDQITTAEWLHYADAFASEF